MKEALVLGLVLALTVAALRLTGELLRERGALSPQTVSLELPERARPPYILAEPDRSGPEHGPLASSRATAVNPVVDHGPGSRGATPTAARSPSHDDSASP